MKKVFLGVAVLALLALASGTFTILYILDWVGHIGIIELFSIFLIVESIAVYLISNIIPPRPRSMTVNFHTGPLSEDVKDIIKNASFSEADLVSFGNYLLSDLRDSRITREHNKKCVGHWDIANWKDKDSEIDPIRDSDISDYTKPTSGKGAGKGHNKGKKASPETRAKISASLKKRNAEKRMNLPKKQEK